MSRGSLSTSARAASLALATLVVGCAGQDELADLRREQRQLARRVADTRADLESLRVSVNRLQGRLDDVTGGRPSSGTTDVERRLRALEGSTTAPTEPPAPSASSGYPPPTPPPGFGTPPPASVPPQASGGSFGAAPSAPAPPPPAEPETSVDPEKDLALGGSDLYRDGIAAYQRGEYPKAVQSLRGFVNKDPKSSLVPVAQYWIGEAYASQRRYNEAILSYNEILVGSPKSDRVPAALLRQAQAFVALGEKQDAKLILKKLISDHPSTEEAASARRMLSSLSG